MVDQSRGVGVGPWAICLLVTCAGGLVLALSDFLPFPEPAWFVALAAFLGGVVCFGALAFIDARRTGSTVWSAMGRGLRMSGRALLQLLP